MTEEIMFDKMTSAFSLRLNEDGVALLCIDCPDAPLNTLQESFVDEIDELIDWLEAQEEVTGLVIYSGKKDSFVAGADIKMISQCTDAEQAQFIAQKGQYIFSRIENLPFHVVAAIDGVCLGGGLELALACHSRIASIEPHTKIGLPEVKLGLLPGSGGCVRLPRLIGTLNAIELIVTGKTLSSKKAQKLSLIDDVVAKSILLSCATALALKPKPVRKGKVSNWFASYNPLGRYLAFKAAKSKVQKKTRNNYPAVNAILQVMEYSLAKGKAAGFEYEAECFGQLAMTRASNALRHLFFISNEAKKENGSDAKPEEINSVAILGAGLMGAGIGYVSAINAQKAVTIKDTSNDKLLRSLKHSFDLLNKKREKNRLTTPELQKQMSHLAVTTEYQDLKHCDMVIEAVYEDLSLKRQMVQDVEKHCKIGTIFATNTSSLPIKKIAESAKNPSNIIGLHYFSPVEKMPLVEVIAHETTSEETIATVVKFAKAQGKTPIVVADKGGFYVNRILAAYLNEASRLLIEGEKIQDIDDALVDFGFPMGPFALLDEVGIDVCAKVSPILYRELGERFKPSPLFEFMINNDLLGSKTQRGFYLYKNGQRHKADKSFHSHIGIKANARLSSQDIALRCFVAMLNECARCFDEKVIRSAKDGDIGAVFGIGFPPFLGGPFCYMNELGITKTVKLMKSFQNRFGKRFAPCDLLIYMMEDKQGFY